MKNKPIYGNPTPTPMKNPDMSQNDERKSDFIKNRTHYETPRVVLAEVHKTSEETQDGWFDGICDVCIDKSLVEVGKEYKYTINGQSGTFIFNNEYMEFGGTSGIVYDYGGDEYNWQTYWSYGAVIDIVLYDGDEIKKLDEKYIPDTIARTSDVEEIKSCLPDKKTREELYKDTKTYTVECEDDWAVVKTEEVIGLIPGEEYSLKIEGINTDGSSVVSQATVKVDKDGNLAYDDDKYDVYIYYSTIEFGIVDYSMTATNFTVSIEGNYAHTVLYQPKIASEEYVNERLTEKFDYTKYPLPVLYLDGDISGMDKDNAVDLSYRFKDMSGTASVKWQGSSSLAYPKKNYTVKFDNKFEAKEGWGEQKKYVMKANWIDFSHSRNIVAAKIWGECIRLYEKYVYAPFPIKDLPNGGAVDGFPVVVVINGEYQGLYTFSIPKDAWMLGMDTTNVNQCIIGASGKDNNMCGFFTMPVIDDDQGFEWEHISDNATDADKAKFQTSLQNLYTALQNCDSSDKLVTNVGAHLELEKAVIYMIYCAHLGNYDGLTKNYLLWNSRASTRWNMSAYDLDSTFGNNPYGDTYYYPGQFDYARLATTNMIFRKIYDYGKDLLMKWQERLYMLATAGINKELYQYAVNIPQIYFDEEIKLWKDIPGTHTNNLAQALSFYTLERQLLIDELSQ